MSGKYPANIVTAGAPAGFSVAFNGNGDQLSVGNVAAAQVGSGDFSIECFVYALRQTNTNAQGLVSYGIAGSSAGTSYLSFQLSSTGNLAIALATGTAYTLTDSSLFPINQWVHAVVCRSGSTLSLYVNGVRVNSTNAPATVGATGDALIIGGQWYANDTTRQLQGYISNVRIVKGSSAYDATQTTLRVPTQLFPIANTSLLTCQSPTLVDNSTNAYSITAANSAAVSTFTPFTGYSATPPNPNTQSNTSGIWTVTDAEYWMAQNKWPMPYPRQSLRFNSADSAYLNRTPSVAGNRKTWTWSGWVKRTSLGTAQSIWGCSISGSATQIFFDSSDRLWLYGSISASVVLSLVSTSVYRDVSAWYNIQVMLDTTQATAANRARMWVNGVELTAFSTATYPAQNTDMLVNTTNAHNIGRDPFSGSNLCNFYLADTYFIDGTALTTASFGQTDAATGAWIPQNYTGSYGTNGFRLTFQNNTGTTATTLGKDWSGVGNNWTPNNFSVAAGSGNDSLVDSPWNFGTDYGNGGEVRGNYCTLNAVATLPAGESNMPNFLNGNLDITGKGTAATWYDGAQSTFIFTSGKYYWETTINAIGGGADLALIAQNSYTAANRIYRSGGNKVINGTSTAYGASFTTGDVIGFAADFDGGTLTCYKNGTSQGVLCSDLASALPAAGWSINPQVAVSGSVSLNFGQRPFAYTAPSGFKAICTTNLPTPAIGATSTTLASANMNVVLDTGANIKTSAQALYTYYFEWIKDRANVNNHQLIDTVRGNTAVLQSNTTAAETTYSTPSGNSVAWVWNANAVAASNTNGSITSTVSANPTAGISVVTWTDPTSGTSYTIGHGLGATPAMVIFKYRNQVSNWLVYHKSIASGSYCYLNSTAAATAIANVVTALSSTTLTLGSYYVDNPAQNLVAYCFSEVAGFSKFGSYTGNNSADGPFVYTGIRSRYIMIKRTDAAAGWFIFDTVRNTYNSANLHLQAQSTAIEGTATAGTPIDILSNGFKIRSDGTAWPELNASGGTYIYAAFAETPFNYSRAR